MDSTRNETPQSIPLADLDGELKLSSLSIASSKSWQSIKSYSSSIKVKNINLRSIQYRNNIEFSNCT